MAVGLRLHACGLQLLTDQDRNNQPHGRFLGWIHSAAQPPERGGLWLHTLLLPLYPFCDIIAKGDTVLLVFFGGGGGGLYGLIGTRDMLYRVPVIAQHFHPCQCPEITVMVDWV